MNAEMAAMIRKIVQHDSRLKNGEAMAIVGDLTMESRESSSSRTSSTDRSPRRRPSFLLMTVHQERMPTSPNQLETNFTKVIPLCHRLRERLRNGQQISVHSEVGTDMTFPIAGRARRTFSLAYRSPGTSPQRLQSR
ncbi:hypothetical protein BH09VER1_BH09VER1_08360 [soil metagenome]